MRWLPIIAACAGCAAAPEPKPAAPAAAAPTLDDDAAVARAREFLDSFDRRDAEAFEVLVTEGFVLFEQGRTMPAASLIKGWFAREGRQPRTRTCEHEKVQRSPTAMVYMGECKEHTPAHGDEVAEEFQGWNTIVLVPEGDTWKVALWQWERSGMEAAVARWNDEYRQGTSFTKEPNRHLVTAVDGVTPGDALVLAMGQGRNALYLASQGWKVTGVDISDEGIRQARAAAAERGLALNAVLADVDEWDFGTARWDLVTMVYAGASLEWMQRLEPAMKPGGLFVLEFFYRAPDDPGDFGVNPDALAAAFSDWEILKNEVVEDIADWGKSEHRLVRFVARKPAAAP